MMTTFTKKIEEKEFLFLLLASKNNIAPELVSWHRSYGNFIVEMVKYPCELSELHDWHPYVDKVKDLVSELHELGIFHGDIQEGNIVINPETNNVKLIDFGLSRWIDTIREEEIPRLHCDEVETIGELLDKEINEIVWLCNNLERD